MAMMLNQEESIDFGGNDREKALNRLARKRKMDKESKNDNAVSVTSGFKKPMKEKAAKAPTVKPMDKKMGRKKRELGGNYIKREMDDKRRASNKEYSDMYPERDIKNTGFGGDSL